MARITNKKTRSFRSGKQTCKVCGCTDKFDFKVPNRLWKKVVPVEYQNKVVCLECFDELAFEKGDAAYMCTRCTFPRYSEAAAVRQNLLLAN